MLKKILVALILAGSTFAFAKDKPDLVLTSKDGHLQITLPDGWAKADRLPAAAQLMALNAAKHSYVELVSESSEDYAGTLEEYAQNRKAFIVGKLANATATDLKKISVNGAEAFRFESHGVLKEAKVKVAYTITVMKVGKNFVQVIAWTAESHFADELPELEKLASAVVETAK
jgi:hypothetical protein